MKGAHTNLYLLLDSGGGVGVVVRLFALDVRRHRAGRRRRRRARARRAHRTRRARHARRRRAAERR